MMMMMMMMIIKTVARLRLIFMQNTYRVLRIHSITAVLWLQFMVQVTLLRKPDVSYSPVCVCVPCPIWLFSVVPWSRVFPVCCSRIFWMILRWLQLSLLLLVSTFVFTLHKHCISIVVSLYCNNNNNNKNNNNKNNNTSNSNYAIL
jgi:hypothetical protein